MASLNIATDLKNLIKRIIYDECYPVGSIYISMNSTSPATRFGGKWVQITDKFLYCTKSSKTTGGSTTTKSHTLTVAQIPAHSHVQNGDLRYSNNSDWWIGGTGGTTIAVDNKSTENTGGGGKATPTVKIFLHILLVTLGTEQLRESWCYL